MADRAAPGTAPDPSLLLQPPPIFGFRYQLPPLLPHFEEPEHLVQEHESCRRQLRALDARQATIEVNAKRGRKRGVTPTFAWGSLIGTIVFFVLIGASEETAGLFMLLFLISFGCLWYSWPYLTGSGDRATIHRLDGQRESLARRISQLERTLERLHAEHEARQVELLSTTPTWFGVPIPAGTIRTEIFGWDKIGWEALLATMGGSLLATGSRLLVLDFSERLVSTLLAHASATAGRQVTQAFLPEQAGELDVFAGLGDDEVVDVLVQAWHGGAVDDRTARVDMNRDRYVLERIRDCLGRPITLDRLAAGAEFVMQQAVDRHRSSVLTDEEQSALVDSFGAAVRTGMQFTDRLMPLTSYLKSLGLLGSGGVRFPLGDAGAHDLAVIALSPTGRILDKAALMELLVQATQRHFATGGSNGGQRPTHVVILGCDLLHNTAIDRLHRFAEHAGVALMLFHSRFDESTAAQAGSGNSTQLFMQLGNRGDAERAADHIGLHRYFVLSSATVNEGKTVTETHGESLTHSHGTSLGMMAVNIGQVPMLIPNVTQTTGRADTTNWGTSEGTTTGRSATATRVLERFVEPEAIQTLPRYAFLWKERGDLPLVSGDCNPQLALTPGAARELPK